MPTEGPVVLALSEESLSERIVRACQRVCFVAPGLYDWVAEALVEVGSRIGWCETYAAEQAAGESRSTKAQQLRRWRPRRGSSSLFSTRV